MVPLPQTVKPLKAPHGCSRLGELGPSQLLCISSHHYHKWTFRVAVSVSILFLLPCSLASKINHSGYIKYVIRVGWNSSAIRGLI